MVTHDPEMAGLAQRKIALSMGRFFVPCRWADGYSAALRLIAHVRLWTTVFTRVLKESIAGAKNPQIQAAKQAAEKVPSETNRSRRSRSLQKDK